MASAAYAKKDASSDSDENEGLGKRRREFESYASAKDREINEQRMSWRYYHADQWTAEQLKILKKRGQPPITFDRTGRKIDGLIGVVRKLRTDPKAFPRTQNQEKGAEVATQVIRTICDSSRFEDLESECARDAAVHGIAVSELLLITGDHGDPDLRQEYVDPRTYFYDPRSVRYDFGDRRFEGVSKWAGLDEVDEISPGAADKVRGANDGGFLTAFDTDRENLWVDDRERVRLVDHWYIEGGIWKWCLHVGTVEISTGESPFYDKDGKSISKFFAFANQIDTDGDHYGYIRRLKGPQDAMNQHRSKSLHIMNTRQVKVRRGAVDEDGGIERLRKEVSRPDGVIEYNGDPADLEVIQPQQEFLQQTQYYQDAKAEIETFGPNQALLGDLGSSASGRAYKMAQQAGLAELGPFLKNFRMWKLAQYEGQWCAAQRYWTSERFLRVTDDQGVAQFMQINGVGQDEYGQPAMVNSLGSIDVDIIIDEGPDTESVMGDVFDTLTALAQNKVPIPPAVIIEASELPGEVKKKLTSMMQQPDPAKEAATKLELEGKAAENDEIKSRAMLNVSKAHEAGQPKSQKPQGFELPPQVQIAQAVADLMETRADTRKTEAETFKTTQEATLAPMKLLHETAHKAADRDQRAEQFRKQAQSAPAH
jgi:hypothetical protein